VPAAQASETARTKTSALTAAQIVIAKTRPCTPWCPMGLPLSGRPLGWGE